MSRYPKIALGLIIITIAIVFFGAVSLKNLKQESTFNLTAEQNKFNLKFNFSKQDKNDFSKFIEKLSLPNDTVSGLSFGLDSTSSAVLTFETPIKGVFSVSSNQIYFNGELARPLTPKEPQVSAFRFPRNLNFALAMEGISENAKKYLSIPERVVNDIKENSAASVQILAFYGPESNIIYVFKTGNFDIETYKNLKPEESGIVLKEEMVNDTKFSLLNNLVFFQLGEWTFVSSSLDTAKNLFQQQKDPKDSLYFPPKGSSASPSLAMLYQNTATSPISESVLVAIFGSKEKIPNSLLKLEKIEFTVNKKNFTGSLITREK